MKFLYLTFLAFILLAGTSCHRNRMKNNEKSLIKQILTEEQQLAHDEILRAEHEKQLTDSLATLPKGFRFKEDRSTDPQNPPEVIDIAGRLDMVREFKLSDVAGSIRYIRLQLPPDSSFTGDLNNSFQARTNDALLKQELPFNVIKNDDFIIAFNYLGMLLYNSNGQLLRVICKNEFTGMSLSKRGVAGGSGSTFKGTRGNPRLIGSRLYYNYEDDVNKISRLMEYDCTNLTLSLPKNKEGINSVIGMGSPIAQTGENSHSAFPLSSTTFSKTGHPIRHEDMLTIYSIGGDTLCSFKGNQKIKNYTKTLGRTPDWGTNFTFKGCFYFRETHSDTIFKVLPPNRLIPAFIINLGKYKIEKIQQGMDPSYDLSNKFMPKTVEITKNYLFFHYTKDYNSPNARKKKSVKFHYAIYDRRSKELWHVPANQDEWNYGLENNLDGGFPVWPGMFSNKYYAPSSITDNGEILLTVKGNDLKEYIKTDEFKNSAAPVSRKKEFEQLAKTVAKFENIVIIMN